MIKAESYAKTDLTLMKARSGRVENRSVPEKRISIKSKILLDFAET